MSRKILIGIHGLGNKPPHRLLEKWWKAAICEGLSAVGHPRPFVKFKLVYWADLLHPQSLDPRQPDKKHPLYISDPYVASAETYSQSKNLIRQKISDILERQMHKLFLADDHSVNFSSISDFIIRHFFRDLDIYYSSMIRDQKGVQRRASELIRQRLRDMLKKYRRREILLIGHSMGSIISYDVLNDEISEAMVDTWVTMGSPLGLPVIIQKILSGSGKKTLSTPKNISNAWHNYADLTDKVALDYSLIDEYAENSNGVRVTDHIVINNYKYAGRRNPHKSYGYLRAPAFTDVVLQFLNRGQRPSFIRLIEHLGRVYERLRGSAARPGKHRTTIN